MAAENCWESDACLRIAGVGHGFVVSDEAIPVAQRQLLAIRAAKVDALRSLAEQVKGVRLQSASTLSEANLIGDRTETSVDAVLRGVRYIKVEPVQPGIYQAIAEVDVYR